MGRPINAAQFEDLYRATAKDVFTYVRRRVTDDAEEIVAETYAIAWRRQAGMPASPFRRAWLFGIARTLVLAEHRRQLRERNTVRDATRIVAAPVHAAGGNGEPADDETYSASPQTLSEAPCRDDVLEAALERLTPMQREILRLTAWECLTPGEVAVALGVKPGVARVRLHRARQALAADPQVRALAERPYPITKR